VTFAEPLWLLLLAPVLLAWWRTRPASSVLAWLRLVTYALLIAAIAGPAMVIERSGGTVVVVADRSDSMPATAKAAQLEAVALLRESMRSADRLAVVGFGVAAQIEAAPGASTADVFTRTADGSASNLGAALRRALTLVETGSPARVLVLSDGRATDGVGPAEAALAAARGVAIDYRYLARPSGADVAIDDVIAPAAAAPGEAFMIQGVVRAPQTGVVNYELRRGDTVIASGTTEVSAASTRLSFRDISPQSGTLDYTLRVSAAGEDPVPENNTARLLVGVKAASRILLVSDTPAEGLARLLVAAGLDVERRSPSDLDASIESLARYDAVIIENVPIQALGLAAAQNLALLVRERGTGLVMTGGRRSFAGGGYYNSVLDPVLPVSMELRSDFRKVRVAIVVVMDRSGSMAAPVAGGLTKMNLAGAASARVVEMLAPADQFGAIVVDSDASTVIPLQSAESARNQTGMLRRLEAGGGGIYIYEALEAAAEMVLRAGAEIGARHIILFADAADSEEPGAYTRLLADLRTAGVTVSVVGLGSPADVDAWLLRDIAQRGDGRDFFTADANLLPELFTQDTVAVSRGAMFDTPTALRADPGLYALTGRDMGPIPAAGGYNPLTLKPGATSAITTLDEYAVPFLSFWNVGLGRSAALAGEADGVLTGEIATWPRHAELMSAIARWSAGRESRLGPSMAVRQSVREGVARIELYTDPDAAASVGNPAVRVLRRADAGGVITEIVPMLFDAPDRLVAEIPLTGRDVIVPTIDMGDGRREPMAPATLAYSPEYRPVDERAGRRLLEDLAARTGGQERAQIASMWDDMTTTPQITPLRSWLLSLVIVVLLTEVAQRRLNVVGVLTSRRPAKLTRTTAEQATMQRGPLPRPARPVRAASGAIAQPPAPSPSQPASTGSRSDTPPDTGATPPSGVLDAMRSVQKRQRP
jgi:Mg-chelatase subunit ChlD